MPKVIIVGPGAGVSPHDSILVPLIPSELSPFYHYLSKDAYRRRGLRLRAQYCNCGAQEARPGFARSSYSNC